MEVISFDIETIPWRKPLSECQEEILEKELKDTINKRYPNIESMTPEDYTDLHTLVKSVNPYLGEIVVIGLYHSDGTDMEKLGLYGDEAEILRKFWNILSKFKGLFVSFNGINFDAPFIIKRSMYHKIIPTNNDFLNLKKFSTYPHFDVKTVMGNHSQYANGTLKQVCDFLGVPSPKEGEIKANQVYPAFLDGKIELISEYCLRDTESTYQCYEQMKKYQFNPIAK